MAYAFQRIDDALNQNESNIFGQQQGGGDTNEQMQQASGVKTSTSGDLGSSNVASSSTQGVQDYNPKQVSDADVLSRNVGKTDVGRGGVSKISNQIAENQKRLEDDANKYRQTVESDTDYSGTTSDKNLQSAVQGDQDAMESVSGLRSQSAYYRPEFEGGDYTVKDADLLGNNAGLMKLASKGQDPRYTSGMAAFDTMLMQRDPEFQSLVNQVRSDNRALGDVSQSRPDELEDWAQTQGETSLKSAQEQAEDWLGNYQKGLVDQNIAEREAFQAQIAGLNEQDIQQRAIDDVLAKILPDLEQATGYTDLRDFAPNIDGDFVGIIDPSQFTYRDFVDQGEADQFNNLARLLGGGEAYGVGRTPTPEDLYQIDELGLREALQSGIMGGKTADIKRRTGDIQTDIDLARDRNYGSDLVRHYYENVLTEKELGIEPGRGLMDDGHGGGLSDVESQRLSDYRSLRDRYGDNFEQIYDRDARASQILDILDGRA